MLQRLWARVVVKNYSSLIRCLDGLLEPLLCSSNQGLLPGDARNLSLNVHPTGRLLQATRQPTQAKFPPAYVTESRIRNTALCDSRLGLPGLGFRVCMD